ncbi:hypothetical protein B0H16DRAFT_1740852 [Mycena metata]|uniref:Transmembrane protein n=1 Tax=Mycena metata TaxID=1033252 RepID=A0AAD7MI11_9AGAR|nr:hypothetical protein B0H16DRAFT_1740852 [Mycena metata]
MASTFQLNPPSAAFVADRVDTLGPWVLGAFTDCMLMGVLLCQAVTFFRTRSPEKTAFQQYCFWLVVFVLVLSSLKTCQLMAVVWVQNTGITGFTVQSFFCLRYYLLSRNLYLVLAILGSMILGLTAICLTLHFILILNAKAKVEWLLIHLVGVFVADALITAGTFFALRKRSSGQGLHRRKTPMASPAQLQTLNCINGYRRRPGDALSNEVYASSGHMRSRHTNAELGLGSKASQIYVQTRVSTYVSPASDKDRVISQGYGGNK